MHQILNRMKIKCLINLIKFLIGGFGGDFDGYYWDFLCPMIKVLMYQLRYTLK